MRLVVHKYVTRSWLAIEVSE